MPSDARSFGLFVAIILGLLLMGSLAACNDNDGGSGNTSPPGGNVTSPGSLKIQTGYGPVVGVRKTTQGLFEGTPETPIRQFLGIPYAAPPVGELRWKPPQPPKQWAQPLQANAFGPFCPQTKELHTPSTTEDCLYLNVRSE